MTDHQLIQAFKHNETDKIHEGIAQYSSLLFYVAQNILKDKGTVEDIEECVADVFIIYGNIPITLMHVKVRSKTTFASLPKARHLINTAN